MTRLAAIVVLLIAHPALAQLNERPQLAPTVTLEEVDQTTLAQLQRADKFFAEKQYVDGLETLRRAIEQQGQRLTPVSAKSSPAGFTTYLPLTEHGQMRLCKLPPEALKLYRSQIDGEAASLLDRARETHDDHLLERIVRRYLASSVGDEAALLLGDAALKRGDIVAARRAWSQVHPALRVSEEAAQQLGVYPALSWYRAFRGRPLKLSDEVVLELLQSAAGNSLLPAHPDTNLPLAEVRARLIAASIFESDVPRAEWELAIFRALHAGQQGRLGARTGVYADLLQQLLAQSRSWPSVAPSFEWPTFAGSYARGQVAGGTFEISAKPLWTAELPRWKGDRDVTGSGRVRVAENDDGLLSYHPIFFQGEVIVGDGLSLRAFELATGRPTWEVPLRERAALELLTNQQAGVPRFTLSASEGLIAATLPTPLIPRQRAATIRREELSRIVAIDVVTKKLVFDAVADDATMIYEGTPVIDRGRAYVIVRRQAETIPQLSVACYDIASGRRLWQQPICSAPSLGEGRRVEYANSLLSLVHDTLYCNTNLGVIAALSVSDGAIRWLTRYPRASFPNQKPERTDRHFFRDLNPCLVEQGQVICAPADCERIFSLDTTNGEVIWTLPPNDAADVVHLLGVGNGHLIVSGDYLYWINVTTGQIVTQFPPALPLGPGLALPTPRGRGRGFLAGEAVFWPTEAVLYVFNQSPRRSGKFSLPDQLHEIALSSGNPEGGNLMPAGKCLMVAAPDRLTAFETQPGR